MKKTIATAALIAAALGLTGCGGVGIESSIEEQAAYKAKCEKAGGHIYYDGFNTMRCSFAEEQ